MKKIILIFISLLLMSSLVLGQANRTINLRATWTPNTEPDMAGYNLYRLDGGRVRVNTTLIPHPPSLPYLFSITVPDNSQGTARFVLTAVDTSGNESLDSNEATVPFDFMRPAAPGGFNVVR